MTEKQVAETVEAVLLCRTQKEAAARLGITDRALRKRLAQPAVQDALAEATRGMQEQLERGLWRLSALVVSTLETLLTQGSERTRLQAALALVKHFRDAPRETEFDDGVIAELD